MLALPIAAAKAAVLPKPPDYARSNPLAHSISAVMQLEADPLHEVLFFLPNDCAHTTDRVSRDAVSPTCM
jgi:hypothetical protein